MHRACMSTPHERRMLHSCRVLGRGADPMSERNATLKPAAHKGRPSGGGNNFRNSAGTSPDRIPTTNGRDRSVLAPNNPGLVSTFTGPVSSEFGRMWAQPHTGKSSSDPQPRCRRVGGGAGVAVATWPRHAAEGWRHARGGRGTTDDTPRGATPTATLKAIRCKVWHLTPACAV